MPMTVRPQDYPKFRELLDIICDGDEKARDYAWKWMANMLQKPWEPGQVAFVCRGLKGTGKGKLGWVMSRLIGAASMQITDGGQLAGRFNSHLEDIVLLFVDEAVQSNDKAKQAIIKGLITEPTLAIEKKGIDVRKGVNRLHIYMATNEDFAAPMTTDERRWFVTSVSPRRRKPQKLVRGPGGGDGDRRLPRPDQGPAGRGSL